MFKLTLCVLSSVISFGAFAENSIDTQRPDAPKYAAYGKYKVGVKTLSFSIPDALDIVSIENEQAQVDTSHDKHEHLNRYSRPLVLEIWHPAKENAQGSRLLDTYMRDAKTPIQLKGKARRDAKPLDSVTPFPLVIISHGYPGNRFLLAHLADNLASKGFVVASIDHTDSTYRTLSSFSSTLINRSLDQEATLNFLAEQASEPSSFLYKLADTNNVAIIGYSMGGYGALITAGASVNEALLDSQLAPPHNLLSMHTQSDKQHQSRPDSRIKTIIAFAPWGKNYEMWTPQSLSKVSMPTLLIAGSVDDVSGYENGVRAIWEQMSNAPAALLTFENANHSAGAPMPAPKESFRFDKDLGFYISEHYTDPVWDSVRMNNISQHFATVWLHKYLKSGGLNDDERADSYLNLIPNSNAGVWAKNEKDEIQPEHTYWKGFQNRTAAGLRFEQNRVIDAQ